MKLLKGKGLLISSLIIVAVLVGSIWYVRGVKNKEDKSEDKSVEETNQEENKSEENNEQTKSQLSDFDFDDKKGEISNLGGNYFITNIEFGKHSEEGYERVTITLDSTSSKSPYFEIKEVNSESDPIFDIQGRKASGLSENIIKITLSDTRTFNIDTAKSTYTGSDSINTSGDIITEARLVHIADDSNSQIVLNLAKRSPFKVITLSSPLRLVVDVAL